VYGVCHSLPERWEPLVRLPPFVAFVISSSLQFPAMRGAFDARLVVDIDDHD